MRRKSCLRLDWSCCSWRRWRRQRSHVVTVDWNEPGSRHSSLLWHSSQVHCKTLSSVALAYSLLIYWSTPHAHNAQLYAQMAVGLILSRVSTSMLTYYSIFFRLSDYPAVRLSVCHVPVFSEMVYFLLHMVTQSFYSLPNTDYLCESIFNKVDRVEFKPVCTRLKGLRWKNYNRWWFVVRCAGIMCTASLALFGDSSFTEGELTPEPTGQEGRLDWAFSVSIAGAVCTIVTSLMFYGDAVRMAWTNKSCR